MAIYYWVGGTGNTSDATNHLSTTSGGSPSAANVPTLIDDVIFNSASNATAYTVTINSTFTCRDITMANPASGVITLAGSAAWNVYGLIVLPSGMTRSYSGTLTMLGTGTKTITSNAVSLSLLIFNNSSGTFQLIDTLTITNALTKSAGTFDPNGQTVVLTGASSVLTGTFTFFNLTRTTTALKTDLLQLSADIIVTNLFTCNGNSLINRCSVKSSTAGTQRTITAASVSLSNSDFRDIIGAGAATWTGTSLGNALNNSGITFTTPVTRYWMATSGGSWSSTGSWSTSSGGATGASVPLSQDNCIFDANSITSSSRTITADMPRLGKDIIFTGILNNPIFSNTIDVSIYGSLTLATGMTIVSNANSILFKGNTSCTLTTATVTINTNIDIEVANGSLTLGSNLTLLNTRILTLSYGTFNDGNYNVSFGLFSSSNTNTRALIRGSGTWSITGNSGTVYTISSSGGLTLTKGSNSIQFTYSSATGTRTILGGSTEAVADNLSITAGTDIVTLTGSIFNLDFTGFTGTVTNGARTIYGNYTLGSGLTMTSGSTATIFANSSGTKTITTNSITVGNSITISSSGIIQLVDNITLASLRSLSLTAGTIDINSKILNVSSVAITSSTSKTIAFNAGTIELSNDWTYTGSNLAITNIGGGTVKFTGTTNPRNFAGANLTYGTFWNAITTTGSVLNITGSNTFTEFKVTTYPQTIKFQAGTTNTATIWNIAGTAGNLVTIDSTTAATHTLAKAGGGRVDADYLSVTNSITSPASTFYAGTHSTDGSGNTNWIFNIYIATSIKSVNGLIYANWKSRNAVLKAGIKSVNNLT